MMKRRILRKSSEESLFNPVRMAQAMMAMINNNVVLSSRSDNVGIR